MNDGWLGRGFRRFFSRAAGRHEGRYESFFSWAWRVPAYLSDPRNTPCQRVPAYPSGGRARRREHQKNCFATQSIYHLAALTDSAHTYLELAVLLFVVADELAAL